MVKMLCIKDSNGVCLPHYSVKSGEFYFCNESKRYEDCYETSILDFGDNTYIGLFYKKLFISQAEWRDKQIGSILED